MRRAIRYLPCARGNRAAQRGQVLILGLLLLGAAVLAMTRYAGVGQVVAARAHQTHALDAATYSGALIQARALNMLAYANRAQIGHQLAMAHLVTLGSWASLAGTQAGQLARGNPPGYLIGMLFGPDHGRAYMAASRAAGFDALARPQAQLAHAYARHDRTVREVLVRVQAQVANGLPDARRQAMLEVLAENYPDKSLHENDPASLFRLDILDDKWPDFLVRSDGRALRGFVLDVASLYRFLAPRDHTARNNWVVQARCPSRRHELRRRGRSQMDDMGRWESLDTESFHALRSNRWIGCYHREYPMGWGWIPTARSHVMDADHVENPPEDFSSQDFWRWVRDHTRWNIAEGSANPLASSRAAVARQRWEGGGLQPFFDVRTPTASSQADRDRVGFHAVLRQAGPMGLTLTTRSAAEAFFDRPVARTDGRLESASLFRPYWQARLSPSRSIIGGRQP